MREELPERKDVEGSGEGGFDCLIIADEAGRAGILLALTILLSKPDHFNGIALLGEASLAAAAEPPSLLDEFTTLLT